MIDLISREEKILSVIEGIRGDIEAIQQNRSNYQIKHFVVGQHQTPARQRMQTVLELQIKLFNIRRAQLSADKINVELDRLISSGERMEPFDEKLRMIEIEEKKTDLAEIELSRLSQVREAECLYAILHELPTFTYEQYQEEEDKYWILRIGEQIELSRLNTGAPGVGNHQALLQMNRPILQSLDPALVAKTSVDLISLTGEE